MDRYGIKGIGHEHIELLPRLYESAGRLWLVRAQSRRDFGRDRETIERLFVNERSHGWR
jgi:hypothetical protein